MNSFRIRYKFVQKTQNLMETTNKIYFTIEYIKSTTNTIQRFSGSITSNGKNPLEVRGKYNTDPLKEIALNKLREKMGKDVKPIQIYLENAGNGTNTILYFNKN